MWTTVHLVSKVGAEMAQRCGVCAHPRREAVDAILRAEHNLSKLARDLKLTRFAVQRHRDNHLVRLAERSTDSPDLGAAPPPPTKPRTDPQTAFLTSYSANGDLKEALKAADATRSQLRRWQEHDPEFVLRFHQAETEAIEALEAEARIRAVAGSKIVRRVFRHGLLYEEIHEWRPSDAMLTKLLQAHKPEKYGDRLTLTQTTVVKAVDADAWNSV
jgi:hypothetical protein